MLIGHLLLIVTPARVCSMVLEGDQATPTEGSYDSHVIKQEEQEEEDEGEFKMDHVISFLYHS